jgi:hypothetical protein
MNKKTQTRKRAILLAEANFSSGLLASPSLPHVVALLINVRSSVQKGPSHQIPGRQKSTSQTIRRFWVYVSLGKSDFFLTPKFETASVFCIHTNRLANSTYAAELKAFTTAYPEDGWRNGEGRRRFGARRIMPPAATQNVLPVQHCLQKRHFNRQIAVFY